VDNSGQFDVLRRASNHQLHGLFFYLELTLPLVPKGERRSPQWNLYGLRFVRVQGHSLKSLEFLDWPLYLGLEVLHVELDDLISGPSTVS
jgi:hypothetical protein